MREIAILYLVLNLTLFVGAGFTTVAYSQDSVKTVAILEPIDRESRIASGVKLLLKISLTNAIANTPGYSAYTRSLAEILGEQKFQRTGLVNDADIKKIGRVTGVSYVLRVEVAKIDERSVTLSAEIIEVGSAMVLFSAVETTELTPDTIATRCQLLAKQLFQREHSIVYEQVDRCKAQVEYLTKENNRLDNQNKVLHNNIASQKRQLNESEARIGNLSEELRALKSAYAALESAGNNAHYEVYWLFGTKKELENWKNFPRSKYRKSDYRNFNTFETRTRDSKNLYLKTHHPSGSYRWDFKDPQNTRIIILDKEKFWSISRYCVIQLK